ncbi:hypothetical protein [Streptomyces sp. NPDC048256]|uniref:hypothetical protein n=1 Tax=Streptomyces sp. NPDC048256 TaxID=3154613 RepID=UPI0033E3FDC5
MKPRKGTPIGSDPYTPKSVKPTAVSQHALVRRLGPNGLWSPAFEEIVKAADELAAELGKPVEQFTDAEADRAIELGRQRHDAK